MCLKVLGGANFLMSFALLYGGAAFAQPGLVSNADVEVDVDADGSPDDWFHSSDVSYPEDNGPSAPGARSIQINSANQDWRSEVFPIVPGAEYQVSFDYKFLEGATGEFRADLRFFDGGAFKGEDAPLVAASNLGEWQTLSRTVFAPAYVPDVAAFPNQADLRFSSNLFAPGNGLVRLDNFIIRQVPEPASIVILALAGCGLALTRRRKQSR